MIRLRYCNLAGVGIFAWVVIDRELEEVAAGVAMMI